MAVWGLGFGLVALALSVLLALGFTLPHRDPMIFFVDAAVVAVLLAFGLALSALGFSRRRERDGGLPASALAVNVLAVGVAVFAAVIVLGGGEPDFDEAMSQLVKKQGVGSVQRVTISREPLPLDFDRYGLLALPKGYDGYSRGPMEQERREPLPLVLSLHGYGSHFMEQDSYFGLSELMESYDFALLLANGKRDDEGNRFWNATEFCCGVTEGKPDDAGYLKALVEAAGEYMNVERALVVGMSNGAFMAYRLACDGMPGLAGIVAVAGSSFADPERCDSARPISVLHIHGTEDETIRIGGGSNPEIGEGRYPDAREVAGRWARRADCGLGVEVTPAGLVDIDADVDGFETRILRYGMGRCPGGLSVELWEMHGSSHVPRLSEGFGWLIMGWMLEHGKQE